MENRQLDTCIATLAKVHANRDIFRHRKQGRETIVTMISLRGENTNAVDQEISNIYLLFIFFFSLAALNPVRSLTLTCI